VDFINEAVDPLRMIAVDYFTSQSRRWHRYLCGSYPFDGKYYSYPDYFVVISPSV
jgi:hypothetical protein